MNQQPANNTDSVVQTFMTHRMSDKNIEQLATGRDKEFKDIITAVDKSLAAELKQPLQHVVVYGPRGFGKSFITRMVQVELNKRENVKANTPFILLPEEQQNLNRNPHALIEYIEHKLKDWHSGEDHSWEKAMFQWPDKERLKTQWDKACKSLEQQLDSCLPEGQGTVIVAIENFDSFVGDSI